MVRYIKKFFLLCVIMLCAGCDKDNNSVYNETLDNTSHEEETSYENTQNVGDYFKNVNIVQDYDPNLTCIDSNYIMTMDNDLMYSILSDTASKKTYMYVADLKTGVRMPLCS